MTRFAAILSTVLFAPVAFGQSINLTEKVTPGDRSRTSIDLELKGHLIVGPDGKKEQFPITAKARHAFAERVLATADGLASVTARHYAEATATALVAGEKGERTLPADRRLVVARRNPDGLLCFSPAGPLTRDELDLVTDHFNPQCLAGLLPGKAVDVGDTWPVSDAAAQCACLFDAVVKTQLTGKLTGVKDGVATFTVEGTAEGFEDGAKVSLTVTATGTFDVAAGRVTGLVWKQKDERGQGAVSPASQVEATVTLKRQLLAERPPELSDAVIAKVPDGELPAAMTDLRHADPKCRYTLLHAREWYVTAQTDTHLVLRLLDHGEYVAQATVGVWRKVEAGKHSPVEEFKKAVDATPGWKPGKVLDDGEVQVGVGRWLYRLSAEGKLDNAAVIQTFYLLAGPQGDQVAVTVTFKPDRARAVGTRDAALVTAIEFGKK
jgi:hypothetical protein